MLLDKSNINWIKVGKRIKNLREEKRWTQERLAEFSNISQRYISDLENGNKTNPSYLILLNIANVFNFSCDYLVFGSDNDEDDIVRVPTRRLMSPEQQQKFDTLANYIADYFIDL